MKHVTFTILGAPRTKKNSQIIAHLGKKCPTCKRGKYARPLPSKPYQRWEKDAVLMQKGRVVAPTAAIRIPVQVCARFFRDARRGDLLGYEDALADYLEKRGVVADDVLIQSWDGSRLDVDRVNPRIELTITPLEDPNGSLFDQH